MRYDLSKDEATLIFNGIFDYCAKTIREIDLSEKMKDLESNKKYAKSCRKLIDIICNNEIETIIFRKRRDKMFIKINGKEEFITSTEMWDIYDRIRTMYRVEDLKEEYGDYENEDGQRIKDMSESEIYDLAQQICDLEDDINSDEGIWRLAIENTLEDLKFKKEDKC